MVDLTPAAATKLQSIITEKGLTGYGLRIYISGSGCSGLQYGMGFDKERAGDVITTAVGIQTLIDSASAQYLDGITVDFLDEEGGGFKIENPNPVSGCSCGHERGESGCGN